MFDLFAEITFTASTSLWLLAGLLLAIVITIVTIVASMKMRQWRATPFSFPPDNDIFLSYTSSDAPKVRFVAEQLLAMKEKVWFNEYRVMLASWEDAFEPDMSEGVEAAASAVFFTNNRWSASPWATEKEARPLLSRLNKDKCLEVRFPSETKPHQVVQGLIGIPHIDGGTMDRWSLLEAICRARGIAAPAHLLTQNGYVPLRGHVNDVPYELNIAGWHTQGQGRPSMGNLILPRMRRTIEGITLNVNIIVGKRGIERQKLNVPDDREVFKNLRLLARNYFQKTPLAGKCLGVHLVFQSDLSHGAFTYWGRNAWCRKYAIVLPAKDGGADIEFTFTCTAYGSFNQFCRVAFVFDDLVDSLQYGKWTSG